jgi:hypothetical protein
LQRSEIPDLRGHLQTRKPLFRSSTNTSIEKEV